MESSVTCAICKQYFNDRNNKPHVLPCLHTCCSACLADHSNVAIDCPVCEETYEKRGKIADIFPLDPSRKHVTDCYLVQRNSEKISCDQCSEGQSLATSRCKECGDFLCSTCADVHSKTKLTKHHNVLTLNKLKSSSVEEFRTVQTCQVSGHEGQPFTQYCCNQNCERPICNLCESKDHVGHSVKNINTEYLQSKRQIQTNILDVKQLKEQTKGVAEKIQNELKKLGQNENKLADEIENVFRAHQEALAKRKLELKDTLSHTVANKRQVLESQLKNLKKEAAKIDQVCKFSDEHLSHSDASEFLQIKDRIKSRINTLVQQTTSHEPHQNGDINLDQSANKLNYQEYARQIGYICSSSAYLPHTRVQTFDIEAGREQVCLKITFYDHQNRPLKEPGMDVKAEIKDESGKITKATTKDFTESELCYKVFVRPTHVGEITASVTVKGKPLSETGYRIRVIKGGLAATNDGKIMNRKKHRRTSYFPPLANVTTQDNHQVKACNLVEEETQISEIDENQLNAVLYNEIFCPDINMDLARLHVQNDITDDGRTLNNQKGRKSSGRNVAAAFKTYRGTIATKPLGKVGQYYFEVQVYIFIKRMLRQDLIFEVGISRKPEIDKNYTVDCHPHAWVVCARRCPICRTVCLQAWHNGQRLYHRRIATAAAPGTTVNATYGFLLDARNKQWLIMDAVNRKYLYRFRNVDVSKSLWPVFGAYNPDLVNVTLTLQEGKDTAYALEPPFNP